jgi:Allene oxide cyclase barrel like domain
MRFKSRTTALAVAGAVAAAAAVPALTPAQTTGPRDVTLLMKVLGGTEVKHGKGSSLAPGDGVVIRLAVFDTGGARIGSAYTDCTNVGRRASGENAVLQCTQTYRLRDGQIVTSGVVRFTALDDIQIAIVGGSGAYRGASGHLATGAPVEGYDSVDVLHLDG